MVVNGFHLLLLSPSVLTDKLLLADFGLAKKMAVGQDAITGACGTKVWHAVRNVHAVSAHCSGLPGWEERNQTIFSSSSINEFSFRVQLCTITLHGVDGDAAF